MSSQRYIRASEVGSFLFCRRAWWLGRHDAPSLLEPERARGTAFHLAQGTEMRATGGCRRWAFRLTLAAAILFTLALLRLFFS